MQRTEHILEILEILALKKAVVNVHNNDNQCFKWAVLSALHPVKDHVNKLFHYKKFEHELDFTGISFPVKLDDIVKFEKQNRLAISVYTVKQDGKQLYPILFTKRRDMDPINLLLIEGDEKSHYIWIKNYNRLLSYGPKHTKLFCPYCCHGFRKDSNGKENLRKHKLNCVSYGAQRTKIPEDNWIYFKEITKMQKIPFCIYADFETLNC